ncbi:MAG: AAA family ATPase [Bacteroidales bacterium]|nr:AAA family ATPase [Bacteroidales bacterium]
MKRIKINNLTLENFKGCGYEQINFNDRTTEICGDNGTGKSSIADAWMWLISGKNAAGQSATGKSSFAVLPIGQENVPAKVTAHLEVDGDEITLSRGIESKGKSKSEIFLVDETEVQKKKFDEIITQIFTDDFRTLSIPGEFLAQDWKVQRAALLAGTDVTIADIIKDDDDHEKKIASDFETFGFETWEKSTKKKIKEAKDKLAAIPGKIAAVAAVRPETRDYEAIKAEINKLENEATAASKVPPEFETLNKQKAEIFCNFAKTRNAAMQRANELQNYYNDLKAKQSEANRTHINMIDQARKNLETWNKQRDLLREQWFSVNDSQFTPDESRLVCPLAAEIECQNPILLANKKEAQRKAAENFEISKKAELEKIHVEGLKLKEDCEVTEAEIKKPYKQPYTAEIEIAEKEWHEAESKIPTAPDTTTIDKRLEEIVAAMADKTTAEKATRDKIAELNKQLGEEETAKKCDEQFTAIENERVDLQEKLGDLENDLATGLELKRRQMKAVESEVNAHFNNGLEFVLFEEQVNGDFADTCQLLIDGVPYGRGANRAGEINAALQVIDYLQTKKELALPVFVDNAESVNQHYNINTQTILLRVTNDESLTIK